MSIADKLISGPSSVQTFALTSRKLNFVTQEQSLTVAFMENRIISNVPCPLIKSPSLLQYLWYSIELMYATSCVFVENPLSLSSTSLLHSLIFYHLCL